MTISKQELLAARLAEKRAPRATAARYDKKTGRVVIDLQSGITISVPPAFIDPKLAGASDKDLAKVQLLCGHGLEWEALEAGDSVPNLIEAIFGPDSWKQQWAKRAGQSNSPAKQAASRTNGAMGGRPRKVAAPVQPRRLAKAA